MAQAKVLDGKASRSEPARKESRRSRSRRARQFSTIAVAMAVAAVTISLVFFPKDAFEAAVEGMKVFWEIVFPSLLPFFVLSEMLLGLGVVHFLGVLLEPLMRPLFNVPGVGAFALSMGLAAGYPMDAVITSKFRRQKMCTRVEGERLLAFTNTADPLFMFGAVAVGMFGRPELGAILAGAHYLSSFTVGFIFRFYRHKESSLDAPTAKRGNIFIRASQQLFKARREDGRLFGQLLSDAVTESIKTLLMICGFIMLFSVMNKVLAVTGGFNIINSVLTGLLRLVGFEPTLASGLFQGLLEIDIGTVTISKAIAPLWQKLTIASAVIAWSGLSVHGQVASVINDTDIRMTPYVVARIFHSIISGLYTVLILLLTGGSLPVMTSAGAVFRRVFAAAGLQTVPLVVERFLLNTFQMALFLGGLIVLSLAVYFLRRVRVVWLRVKK